MLGTPEVEATEASVNNHGCGAMRLTPKPNLCDLCDLCGSKALFSTSHARGLAAGAYVRRTGIAASRSNIRASALMGHQS